jgi:hypothetical protein
MRTYIGWWLDSKTYTNRELVPRTEEPEVVDGAVMIRYDNINKHKAKTEKIEMEKITQVIEVDTRVAIKLYDRVKTENGWLKVERVEMYLPVDKETIVRMWPNRRTALEVKRVYLT